MADTRHGAPEGGQETAREFANRICRRNTMSLREISAIIAQRDAETRRRALLWAAELAEHQVVLGTWPEAYARACLEISAAIRQFTAPE